MIGFFLLTRDVVLKKIISTDGLIATLQLMVLSGYVGGRLGFLISESYPLKDYIMLLQFWQPGLSILGGIIAILVSLGLYLWMKKIPILMYLDRVSIYAPLVQSFGRLGCFFAGCCYGVHSNSWWSVTYTHPLHMAPQFVPLHPAQLYSVVILFLIFLFLYFVLQKKSKTSGMLIFSYLFLVSMERFLIDFIRWDRLFFESEKFSYFSIHQWIALAVALGAGIGLFWLIKQSKKSYGSV
jgi:phosphatidylglycerol:prolipoprotein diacylglycerol transferase